jgi:tetratricopeptide (TPR) repeat protein
VSTSREVELATRTRPDLVRAAAACQVAGGYVDLASFAGIMGIDADALRTLGEMGYVQSINRLCVPHDRITEFAAHEANSQQLSEKAARYWSLEVQRRPKSVTAAYRLVTMFRDNSHVAGFSDAPLAQAVGLLWGLNEYSFLPELSEKILGCISQLPQTAFLVAEIRANRGDFEFIDHVASKVSPDAHILLLQSRASWWRGDFNKCRMFAVSASRCLDVNTARVELELAIADFFEGVWDISLARLLDVEQSELASGQDIGWARMLTGTVYGLTGRDIDKGKQYLHSAIVLLEDCSDICGLAIAYGNLGEVYWKSGEYEQALREVLEGRSFATRAGMKLNLVESKRNELHIVIRTEGAHSERAEQLLGELQRLSRQQLGAMVEMQLFNSMATAHLYRGELDLAGECIEAARCLTEGNVEYQIYTLVNSGFLHAARGSFGPAERELVEAVRLAREGGNLLALRQAKHDLEYIVHTPAAKKVRQIKGFLDSIIEGVNK